LAEQFHFNPLSETEFEQLAENIEKHGLYERIVIYEEQILEGWHRYLALKRIGHGFTGIQFIEYHLDSGDPSMFVIARNALRRHLSPEKRRELGAKYFKAMPKEKPGPKPQTKEIAHADNSPQNLRRIPEETQAKDIPVEKRPYDRRLEEAAAVTGTTPGAIRAQLALEKEPEAAAARATGRKPPRAPRKPKPAVAHLNDGHTLGQVFHMMFENGDKTLEVTVAGRGRAVFTLDANVQPLKEGSIPPREKFLAYAAENRIDLGCAADQYEIWLKNGWKDLENTPIRNWQLKLLNYARGYFSQFAKLKPPPQRASPSQRTPEGRSTVMTPAQADRAAAAQAEKMKASLERQQKLDSQEGKWNRR
jgi:hypothetical protein